MAIREAELRNDKQQTFEAKHIKIAFGLGFSFAGLILLVATLIADAINYCF